MPISWTKLPFQAYSLPEFSRNLTEWLSDVFYEVLPAKGYEVREEQIYTTFQMAQALVEGVTLTAEAGPGTGKTFAYLLPAVCYARMKGAPVVVASASGVLQAQLTNPEGDIRTLSRLLDLEIDARLAADPSEYLCELKIDRPYAGEPPENWAAFVDWARRTGTGARSEVPDVPDELWGQLAWDPSLPCDTCSRRGHCHMMNARRHYRAATDLVVCDHRLFSQDLLTRAERVEAGQLPLLPAYSAVILDEGHHVPETWQRTQGYTTTKAQCEETLSRIEILLERPDAFRMLNRTVQDLRRFFRAVGSATEPGEGKRRVARDERITALAAQLNQGAAALQDHMATAEAMLEGTEAELDLRIYQARLDEMQAALRLFQSDDAVVWVQEDHLWAVPRRPVSLFGPGRLAPTTPVIFSSATLEPEYQARVLGLDHYRKSRVGVPFDLSEQALVYLPSGAGDEIARTLAVLKATGGRALVLLTSMAEVQRYKRLLTPLALPWETIWEGEGDRGAQLERFRQQVGAVLFGATFWEGVDVPGEALSCCVVPRLPFPAHDPLIEERRMQAGNEGFDPFTAVDLPEMLIKLKQGAGRLIRTARDRGVFALLDTSFHGQSWADATLAALPEDAERTHDLTRVTAFLAGGGLT